jgi:hypothetical protein
MITLSYLPSLLGYLVDRRPEGIKEYWSDHNHANAPVVSVEVTTKETEIVL